jgi:hypothetical protein
LLFYYFCFAREGINAPSETWTTNVTGRCPINRCWRGRENVFVDGRVGALMFNNGLKFLDVG